MFCNFCGKKIAPEDRVCPYCGQAQESRSGGNGFWDILTNPSAADDADPEPVRTVREPVRPMREPAPPMPTPPVPSDRRRRKTGRGILILSIITVVLLLASIALDVLLFLNIVGINTKLETISEALTEVDGSTEALAPEATSPTSSETKAPTDPATEPTTAPTGEPSTAEGTSDPSATLGATGNDPAEEGSIIIEQPVDIKEGVAAGTEDAIFHIILSMNEVKVGRSFGIMGATQSGTQSTIPKMSSRIDFRLLTRLMVTRALRLSARILVCTDNIGARFCKKMPS